MSHLLRSGSSIFKVGNNVFRVRDLYNYMIAFTTNSGTSANRICWEKTTNKIYVPIQTTNSILVFDGVSFGLLTTITSVTSPNGVAVDVVKNKIFVSSGSGAVIVLNATTYSVITTITAGLGGDNRDIDIDPVNSNNRAICINYSANTAYVIDTNSLSVIGNFAVVSPFGIRFDPIYPVFYIVTLTGTIKSYSTSDYSLITTSSTYLNAPTQITVDPISANNRLLVLNRDSANITSVDRITLGSKGTLPGISFTTLNFGIAFDFVLENNRFIVADNGTGKIAVITQIAS